MAEDLPFSLQDLCLLEVINDLDSYPVELLSSLPHWLRYRLLNNLPVLDLCRLDHTPVARGVNTEEIWKSLPLPSQFYDENIPWNIPSCIPPGQRVRVPLAHAPFLLEPWVRHGTWYIGRYIVRPSDISNLDVEMAKAFQGIPKQFKSCDYAVVKHGEFLLTDTSRQRCLLKAAFHLLDRLEWIGNSSETYVRECKVIFEWLISSTDHKLLPKDKNQANLWSPLQTTALAKYQGVGGETQATPHRLLPIHTKEDPLELFSLLTQDCSLRPSEIALHGLALAKSVRKRFPDERRRGEFYYLLKEFLQSVVVLGLWGRTNEYDKTTLDDTCKAIIEGAVGDGTNCKLCVLYCREITKDDISIIKTFSPSLYRLPCDPGPPRYQGLSAFELFTSVSLQDLLPHLSALLQQQLMLKVVRLRLASQDNNLADVHKLFGTLSSLFLRPQFQALSIKMQEPVESRTSLLLLKGFLIAPCTHEQQLTYDMWCVHEGIEISGSEIASLDMKGESIPPCAVNHKTLLSCTYDVYRTFLLFPTIRLKDLDLTGKELLVFAQHPDIQISKLRLNLLDETFTDSMTSCDGIKVFLKLPTLIELTVYGGWNSTVCLGLAQGLEEQSKVGGSLCSISLCTNNNSRAIMCSGAEFQVLWGAIFSLPQLNNLELSICGRHMLEAVSRYEQDIYDSWRRVASNCQLKLVKCVYEGDARGSYEYSLLRKVSQYCHTL